MAAEDIFLGFSEDDTHLETDKDRHLPMPIWVHLTSASHVAMI